MKMIQDELDRVRLEMEKLKVEEATLSRLLKNMGATDKSAPVLRKR